MPRSHLDELTWPPSALLTDGLLFVPLWGVTRMTLSERYRLPPIGSSGFRAAVGTSEDSVSLTALLVGPQRFAWKQGLELLADLSRRGGLLARRTGGAVGGLVLVTALTVRTDMQVTELSFTATAQRRDTIETSIALQHVPAPNPLNQLLDTGAAAVMTAVDFFGD